ncbi:MAG: glycosyltransferase family 4 protein [Butyrivibrio sp.]|nr:glycosyltransferase family 4 protein [Butyrivibrio sp.]
MDKNSKPKVLMLGPDRAVHGGISALVNSYFEAGIDTMADITYIGTMKEGSRLKKLLVAFCAYLKFLKMLPGCDIVHVNFSSDNSFMRKSLFIRSAKRHGKKLVLHQHGGDFKNYYANEIGEKRRRYIRETLEMADLMLVLTKSWKDYFGELVPGVRIEVLPNGVITDGAPAPDAGKDLKKMLFLGRICRDKGINELLDAMEQIHSDDPEVCLYLGGIYEDQELRSRVEAASEYVKYLGWIGGEEKEKMLDQCGVLVLPSYYEGFPVSVVEGMLHGCVVIASAVGGIPEIITSGEDGILIEPKSTSSIKEALENVMDNRELADKIAAAAVKKVNSSFSIEAILRVLSGFYREL